MTGDTMLREAVNQAMQTLADKHAGVGFLVVAVNPVGHHDVAEVMATHNMPEDVLAVALQHVTTETPTSKAVH